jgi:Fic family protein
MNGLSWTTPSSMEPLMPSSRRSELQDLAWTLGGESAALSSALSSPSRSAVAHLLRIVNSYYSNLIEGHATLPGDIERAYRQDFSEDPQQRDLQIEAKAHVEVERRLRIKIGGKSAPKITAPAFLKWIHEAFYGHLPKSMWECRGDRGKKSTVIPGTFRTERVTVGLHDPPEHSAIDDFMARFDERYRPDTLAGVDRVIAAAASHHRFLWIHPFLDGNGRVARLFTESYLISAGVDSGGLWSISRGLARQQEQYKRLLAAADDQRRGDVDGRGNLSDKALADFCVFFLEQAVDQVRFIRGLLDIGTLQDRILDYVSVETAKGSAPRNSSDLVLQAFLRGRLERGEALKLLGGAERTARSRLSELLDVGLLVQDGLSHRSAIRWGVPVSAGWHYFPQLYPQAPDQELEGAGDGTFIQSLRTLPDEALIEAIDDLLSEHIHSLESEEGVSSAIAETNATGFTPDDYSFGLDDIDLFDDSEARVTFTFHLSGEHDLESDRMYCGDEIEGRGVLVIAADGSCNFDEVVADRVQEPPDWPGEEQIDDEFEEKPEP